ncbi:MAG: hypothetical protein ACI8V5_004755 [Limisphaerales bacterium]|jgi:hypothetical protein
MFSNAYPRRSFLFVFMALISHLPALTNAADAIEQTEIHGEIEYEIYRPDGSMFFQTTKHFLVRVHDCDWSLVTFDPASTNTFTQIANQDGTLFQYSSWATNDSRLQGGRLSHEEMPRDDGTLINYLWLAYASACYFRNQTNDMVQPIWQLDDRTLLENGFRMKAKWLQSAPQNPPSSVIYFNDGMIRVQSSSGVSKVYPAPPPFDQGFTNAIYGAVKQRTVDGVTFPTEFNFTRYMFRVRGTEPTDVIPRTITRGRVSRVTLNSNVKPLQPAFQGRINVIDNRFANADPPVRQLVHAISNNDWTATNDLKRAYEIELRRQAAEAARARSALPERNSRVWSVRILFILIGLIFGLTILKIHKSHR